MASLPQQEWDDPPPSPEAQQQAYDRLQREAAEKAGREQRKKRMFWVGLIGAIVLLRLLSCSFSSHMSTMQKDQEFAEKVEALLHTDPRFTEVRVNAYKRPGSYSFLGSVATQADADALNDLLAKQGLLLEKQDIFLAIGTPLAPPASSTTPAQPTTPASPAAGTPAPTSVNTSATTDPGSPAAPEPESSTTIPASKDGTP